MDEADTDSFVVVADPIAESRTPPEPWRSMSFDEMFERWGDKTPRDSAEVERMIQEAWEDEAARRILGL